MLLGLSTAVQIFLSAAPTDMRKGIDGLAAIVKAQGFELFTGHLFVFVSKRRDRAKILTWDRGGFVMWLKRLEKGRFKLPPLDGSTIKLDSCQLAMLLDGVDLKKVRRQNFWQPTMVKKI